MRGAQGPSRAGDGLRTITLTHDVACVGSVSFCLRCGAVPGSERFAGGCRTVRVSIDGAQKARPAHPVLSRVRPYDRELDEYFNESHHIGGLQSNFMTEAGGGAMDERVTVPGYLTDGMLRRIEQFARTYRLMAALPWRTQETLRRFYEGLKVHADEATEAHAAFADLRTLARLRPVQEPRYSGDAGQSYTTAELAERAGVSVRQMRRLISDAGVGNQVARGDQGGRVFVVSDQEFEELKNS